MTIKEAIEILNMKVGCRESTYQFCDAYKYCKGCKYYISDLKITDAMKVIINALKNNNLVSKQEMKRISYDFWEDKISRDYVHMFMDVIDELPSGVENDL